jgi:hypothetical protein
MLPVGAYSTTDHLLGYFLCVCTTENSLWNICKLLFELYNPPMMTGCIYKPILVIPNDLYHAIVPLASIVF